MYRLDYAKRWEWVLRRCSKAVSQNKHGRLTSGVLADAVAAAIGSKASWAAGPLITENGSVLKVYPSRLKGATSNNAGRLHYWRKIFAAFLGPIYLEASRNRYPYLFGPGNVSWRSCIEWDDIQVVKTALRAAEGYQRASLVIVAADFNEIGSVQELPVGLRQWRLRPAIHDALEAATTTLGQANLRLHLTDRSTKTSKGDYPGCLVPIALPWLVATRVRDLDVDCEDDCAIQLHGELGVGAVEVDNIRFHAPTRCDSSSVPRMCLSISADYLRVANMVQYTGEANLTVSLQTREADINRILRTSSLELIGGRLRVGERTDVDGIQLYLGASLSAGLLNRHSMRRNPGYYSPDLPGRVLGNGVVTCRQLICDLGPTSWKVDLTGFLVVEEPCSFPERVEVISGVFLPLCEYKDPEGFAESFCRTANRGGLRLVFVPPLIDAPADPRRVVRRVRLKQPALSSEKDSP